jgi:hypothetical protein
VLVLEANNRAMPFVALAPEAPISRDVGRISAELTKAMDPTPRRAASATVQ